MQAFSHIFSFFDIYNFYMHHKLCGFLIFRILIQYLLNFEFYFSQKKREPIKVRAL